MLSMSPRKVVPLSTGGYYSQRTPSTTKRVFYAAVVVEGAENNRELPPDVNNLIISLGRPVSSITSSPPLAASTPATTTSNKPLPSVSNPEALAERINELIRTEQTYVQRLGTLKRNYADPLRNYSKKKETVIIPAYEATTLFGNIDSILPVNQAFLTDLEKMAGPNSARTVGGIGDVTVKHLKTLKGFEQYRHYYAKRIEAQDLFEKEVRYNKGFENFIDHIKYDVSDVTNRIGLRELLAEPIQRIPRYTLLLREMIRFMSPNDPQRAKLLIAIDAASAIAKAEPDEETKRAAIMTCLNASISGFPADLISHSRKFIDCIDVEDTLGVNGGDLPSSSSSGNLTGTTLHCTLFLFDDKLVIVKRPSEKGGKILAGLDDIERSTKGTKKKPPMSFKGVLDITDIVATDVGGDDMHLYLETPPQGAELTDRWANRPFRSLTVVNPPAGLHLDPIKSESDKKRFLENLWLVQAKYRSRYDQSIVLAREEEEVESKGGRVTWARTYFNVYQRVAFLQELKKSKVVVHIDPSGFADDIPFGPPPSSPPLVIIRVQPMAGDLCRYKVICSDPNDEGENDIVQTTRVPERIVHTIHQFGLYKFKTFNNSLPSTPTASTRSRAAIFGLDAISRNLFSSTSRPSSSHAGRSEFGSISGSSQHKRSKSAASRSSAYTSGTVTSASNTTTNTGEGSFTKFSYRSNSTAVTTMSSMAMSTNGRKPAVSDDEDDDERFFATRSASKSGKTSKSKKLQKRGRSPAGSDSEGGNLSSSGGLLRRARSITRPARPSSLSSRSRSRTGSVSSSIYSSGGEDNDDGVVRQMPKDQSELDLALRLDLARRNSKNQHTTPASGVVMPDGLVEETIYEEEPPHPLRPESRASKESSQCTITQRPESRTSMRPESRTSVRPESRASMHSHLRSHSPASPERRPMGPRSPSPLPWMSPNLVSRSGDDLERTLLDLQSRGEDETEIHTPIPKSKRQPFFPTGNTTATDNVSTKAVYGSVISDASFTMTPNGVNLSSRNSTIEPLSIKKKASVRSNTSTTTTPSARKSYVRNSPLSKTSSRIVSPPRRVSPQIRMLRNTSGGSSPKADDQALSKLAQLAKTTKADIDSSRRAIKRIKLEVEKGSMAASDYSRPSSPDKFSRATPKPTTPISKQAQERLEEMRQLIGRRSEDIIGTPTKRRPDSVFASRVAAFSSIGNGVSSDGLSRSVEDATMEADEHLCRASDNLDVFASDLQHLAADIKAKLLEYDKGKTELLNAKRQCDLVKSLLADATAEKEIMYEAFNEELDAMYNDANLPQDEAWISMSKDLQKAKESRNHLNMENSTLRTRLAEAEMQRDQWGDLLRAHGLIS